MTPVTGPAESPRSFPHQHWHFTFPWTVHGVHVTPNQVAFVALPRRRPVEVSVRRREFLVLTGERTGASPLGRSRDLHDRHLRWIFKHDAWTIPSVVVGGLRAAYIYGRLSIEGVEIKVPPP
jgi:hypothetical protein